MKSKTIEKSGQKARVSGRGLNSMLKDYVEGKKSVDAIAKHYGVTPGALTTRVKKLGLPLRGRGRWQREKPTPKQKQIIAFAAKESCQKAALKFGISKQRVSKIVSRWKDQSLSSSAKRCEPKASISAAASQQKLHVISFRVDSYFLDRLKRELQRSIFKALESPSEVARELLMIFLSRTRIS